MADRHYQPVAEHHHRDRHHPERVDVPPALGRSAPRQVP